MYYGANGTVHAKLKNDNPLCIYFLFVSPKIYNTASLAVSYTHTHTLKHV